MCNPEDSGETKKNSKKRASSVGREREREIDREREREREAMTTTNGGRKELAQ